MKWLKTEAVPFCVGRKGIREGNHTRKAVCCVVYESIPYLRLLPQRFDVFGVWGEEEAGVDAQLH